MCMDSTYKKLTISDYRVYDDDEIYIDLTRYFAMNPANLYNTDYYHTHSLDTEYPVINPPNYPHVIFINKNTATSNIEKVLFIDKNTIEEDGKNQPIRVNLRPGTYDIKLINPLSVSNAYTFLEDNMRYHDSPGGKIFINKLTYDNKKGRRNNWCGLRIKSIVSRTGLADDEPLRKYFCYDKAGDPAGISGVVNYTPQYLHKYFTYYSYHDGHVGYNFSDVIAVGTIPFPNSPKEKYSDIAYPYIIEYMGKEDREEPDSYLNYYKRFSHFSDGESSTPLDINETEFYIHQPVGARMMTSKSHYRGNLISKGKMANTMLNFQGVSYTYNIYENDSTPYLTTNPFTICDYADVPGISTYCLPEYGIGRYHIIPYTKTISTETYEESDGVVITKYYDYFYDKYTDDIDYNLLRSETICNSENQTFTTFYTYPRIESFESESHHFPNPETIVTVADQNIISAKRNTYDSSGNIIKIYEASSIPNQISELLSADKNTTETQRNLINDPTYEYRYNDRGNLIQISYKGAPLASYIWGYNGLYPVIEATDVDYDTLVGMALQSGLTLNQINGQDVSTDSLISSVVERLQQKMPTSALSAISYHWLMGVAQITSPRGSASSFSYDGRGRLVEVRDFNNYLINKYQYHYASENTL